LTEIACGLLGMLAIEHDILWFGITVSILLVLLGGWKFLGLGNVVNEYMVKMFILGLFVIMLDLLIARIFGSSVYHQADWVLAVWSQLQHARPAMVLAVGLIFFLVGVAIYHYAPYSHMKNGGLYVGGGIGIICLLLFLVLAIRPRHTAPSPDASGGATVTTTTSPDPRPVRSAAPGEHHG
jgi:hypothetical protein